MSLKCTNDGTRPIRVRNTVTGKLVSIGPGFVVSGLGWEEAVEKGELTIVGGAFRKPQHTRVGTTSQTVAQTSDDDPVLPDPDGKGVKRGDQSNVSEAAKALANTQEVIEEDPVVEEAPVVEEDPKPELPNGWEAILDEESGQTYYSNADLNTTQWEFPSQEPKEEEQPPADGAQGDGFDPAMSPEAREARIAQLGNVSGEDVGDSLRELFIIRDYLNVYDANSDHIALVNTQLKRLGADTEA
jgi:hypothetical protein